MEEKKYRVIVAHPGKQHSFRLATALNKAGLLDSYCTTVYNKNSSVLMNIAKLFAKGTNKKRIENRYNPNLDDTNVIQFCEFLGLLTIAAARLDKTKNRSVYRRIYLFTSKRFGEKVAEYAIKKNVDAVICYDTGALGCWTVLSKKAPHIKRIVDSSHMARPAEKRLIEREVEERGDISLKEENLYLWKDKNIRKFQQEIDLTEYFLCPSEFVCQSLKQCGVQEERCLKVPYGANLKSDRVVQEAASVIKFVFVGGVSSSKGVHHLLQTFTKLDTQQADLTLVGACNYEGELYKKYSSISNIHFTGWVTPDEVKKYYETSDVFVLFSPREGMAQVGIEAMSCGLPIIVSDHTGVNDLVEEGINGFVVPYGDTNELYEKMLWFLNNRQDIKQMGEAARKTGRIYTWQRYETQIVSSINEIIKGIKQ